MAKAAEPSLSTYFMYALLLEVKIDPVFVVCRSQHEETPYENGSFCFWSKIPALTSNNGLPLTPPPLPPT